MYKTMSVHRALAQVAPFKRYVATATSELYDVNGKEISGGDVAAGRVLMDMGKYSVATTSSIPAGAAAGATLRKVQVLPIDSHLAVYSVPTYIYLGDNVPTAQKIAALN